mgnify:CR=1 FL=1
MRRYDFCKTVASPQNVYLEKVEIMIPVLSSQTNFKKRQAAWCEANGLRPSKAGHQSALRWLPSWHLQIGFDHTDVYYYPRRRIHILLTEPYHSTQEAQLSLQEMAAQKNGTYTCVVGRAGTGLWFPGACIPLLIAVEWADKILSEFAANLPESDVAPSDALL